MEQCQIVLCPCPDKREAQHIADALVEQELAAAVNIVAQDSVYRWRGKIARETEFLLIIKSQRKNYESIEQTIIAMHSYELPGIAVVPIVNGFAPYLKWIESRGTV